MKHMGTGTAIGAALFAFLLSPQLAHAAVVAVAAGQSIQTAINANPNGTTFNIAAGTFNEALTPKPSDIFIGAGIGSTILNGGNSRNVGFDGSGNSAANVSISKMTITAFTDHGIKMQTWANSGWVIDSVELSYNHDGISLGTNTTFKNSIVHHTVFHQIHLTGNGSALSNNLIDNNEFYINNTSNTSPFGVTADAGWKFNGGGGDIIQNNKIHDNYGNGIWFDSNGEGFTVRNNEIYNNRPGAGLSSEIQARSTSSSTPIFHYYGNYIHDSDIAIDFANSGDAEVYGNALSNNGTAMRFFDEGNRGGDVYNGLPLIETNIKFHDNYVAVGSGQLAFNGDDNGFQNWKTQNNTFSTNTYYLTSTTAAVWSDNGTNKTPSQWQGLGFDAGSTFTSNAGTLPAGVGPRGGFTAPGSLVACTNYYTGSIAVPSGYAAAYNVFTQTKESIVSVDCTKSPVVLQTLSGLSTQNVYTTAYLSKNGAAWTPLALTSPTNAPSVNGFFPSNASVPLSGVSDTDLTAGWNFIAAYSCYWNGSSWKCGCSDAACTASPAWSLQAFHR